VVGVLALDTRENLKLLSPNEISVEHHECITSTGGGFAAIRK
jgi:hypothetical protein